MNLRWSRGGAVAAGASLTLWVVACSSSSHGSAAGAGTSGDSGGDGAPLDGGAESGGESGVQTTPSTIVVEQLITPVGTIIGNIAVALDPQYASGLTCARTVSGPCTIDDCSAVAAQDGGTLVGESAGVITMSGGGLPHMLTLQYSTNTDNYRYPIGGIKPLFAQGQTLQVSAPGDVFPAFAGQSAPAPGPITVTAPALTMGSAGPTYTFDPTMPLTWSWMQDAGAGDSVTFSVATASDLIITCTFDATSNTGTIPLDVVTRLPAMADDIEIFTTSSATLDAGTQKVLFQLSTGGPQALIAPQ